MVDAMEAEIRIKKADDSAPRANALSWDDYFMSVAFLTAMRSKDPTTQVGAVIVDNLHHIIGVGYNGFPSGIPDENLPWAKAAPEGELATKYPYVVHAELNAVMNKNAESCRGTRIYSTLFPCNECAKVIIQAGIRKVIFASDKHHLRASSTASRKLLSLAGVEMVHYQPRLPQLNIALRYPEDEPYPEPNSSPGSHGAWSPLAYCPQCSSPAAASTTASSGGAPAGEATPSKSLLASFEATTSGPLGGSSGRGGAPAVAAASALAACLLGAYAWRRAYRPA